ncbi:MAG: hypothetical protein ABI619_00085 [Betaproteobacteria bacterium]
MDSADAAAGGMQRAARRNPVLRVNSRVFPLAFFPVGARCMFHGNNGVVAAMLLAGCSSFAPMDPDFTPVNPTAVLETRVVSTGGRDFPVFESTRVSFTRANMRRHEVSKGSNPVSRAVDVEKDVLIERLDRNLALTLDARSRKAIKCPLATCAARSSGEPPQKTYANRGQDAACRLKVGKSVLSMEPTGRKRNVNGFDAEQYDVKWLVALRDNASHESTSTISIDLWTTPITPALQDAIALEKTYARSLDKMLGTSSGFATPEWFPAEAALTINRYLSASVSPSDRAKFLEGANGLDQTPHRHPVLMHIKWNLAGEACSMDKSMKDLGDKPLYSFLSEVKVHTMAPLHDSLFMPPKGYKVTK